MTYEPIPGYDDLDPCEQCGDSFEGEYCEKCNAEPELNLTSWNR